MGQYVWYSRTYPPEALDLQTSYCVIRAVPLRCRIPLVVQGKLGSCATLETCPEGVQIW